MTDDLEELAVLQPESEFIVVKGISFEVKPFKFMQFMKVLKHVYNLVEDINPYDDQTKQVFRLFGEHPEDIIGILAIAIGKPVDLLS